MITSLQNGYVKRWKKLKRRRGREKERAFLVEGFHLVEEALKSDWTVQEIVIREDINIQNEWQGYKYVQVTNEVFQEIADTDHPQGVAAVVEMKEMEWEGANRVLLLDSIQDPGNLGTIIRTADAAGFDAIMLGKGTVDPYNDKVIRSTQGSIFHLPVFQEELEEIIPSMRQEGTTVWATSLQGATPYMEKTIPDEPFALLVGNEGSGVQEELLQLADERVNIPMYGQAESLNVAVATGILLYAMRG
ncbi:23S rRNA methyltransferase [Pontibacillus halophilus JSM 076056 = DSM 19796]|uniref:23S rRNA methyltransferase n=1 Tax=Pontibacillus halophilus JSM 076056 = DSM 19796 TaxID=1385510 RepID=A0A0A5GQF9_9BACI|nr:RNA methyltransferase [Pontibacillus halophilus]KGX93410.1 23S rRNA methyltransferase [Pontibacillus halophilus JSM 076056 = DSM 19796]